MKAIILAVIFQITLFSFSYSQRYKFQTCDSTDNFWSMSLYGGGAFNFIDNLNDNYTSSLGATGGIETAFNFSEAKSAVIFSLGFTSFPGHIQRTENYYINRTYKNEKIEISFGPRFFVNNDFFIQGAFAVYAQYFRKIYEGEIIDPEFYNFINHSNGDGGFGFNVGGGKLFSLSKTISMITIGKVHFSSPGNHGILYFTLDAGIQIKNNNTVQNSRQNKSNMSVAVYGGFANMEGLHSVVYQILPNIGIEGTYRTGFNELFINVFYNQYNYKSSSNLKPKSITAILIGERLFIGNENTKGFIEFGGGVYAYENKTSSKTPADNAGIVSGTGIYQKINSHLSGIVKADFNWIFNEHLEENSFLALDAGLRWDF